MKIDYKLIIIISLLIGLIGMITFWPSDNTKDYIDEIDKLNKENKELFEFNDRLEKDNLEKDSLVFKIKNEIILLEKETERLDSIIKKINTRRDEIRNSVNNMDKSAVVSGITDYIKRRKVGN